MGGSEGENIRIPVSPNITRWGQFFHRWGIIRDVPQLYMPRKTYRLYSLAENGTVISTPRQARVQLNPRKTVSCDSFMDVEIFQQLSP